VSSTCFEHSSVHPQEDLYKQFYGISIMYFFFVKLSFIGHFSRELSHCIRMSSKRCFKCAVAGVEQCSFVFPYHICR